MTRLLNAVFPHSVFAPFQILAGNPLQALPLHLPTARAYASNDPDGAACGWRPEEAGLNPSAIGLWKEF